MEERWFVTGDCHGSLTKILQFIWKFDLGPESNIIVCGDMGIFWNKDQKDAKATIANYERYCNGVHLYWIDGNHENFSIIDSWNATKEETYDNSEHIHYCPRGAMLNINGKKALCMGGADSIDKAWRKEGFSWWSQEQITEKDIAEVGGYYDYVFTHCCPYSIFHRNRGFLCQHGGELRDVTHKSEEMLDKMFNKIDFGHHYFGHYHINLKLDDKHTCLLDDFIELE